MCEWVYTCAWCVQIIRDGSQWRVCKTQAEIDALQMMMWQGGPWPTEVFHELPGLKPALPSSAVCSTRSLALFNIRENPKQDVFTYALQNQLCQPAVPMESLQPDHRINVLANGLKTGPPTLAPRVIDLPVAPSPPRTLHSFVLFLSWVLFFKVEKQEIWTTTLIYKMECAGSTCINHKQQNKMFPALDLYATFHAGCQERCKMEVES